MLLSKEYVGYLARETVKRLAASEFIETKSLPAVTEKVHAAMLEELALEDRINDEVRVILEAYSDEMRNTGANYQEMFRKVLEDLLNQEARIDQSARQKIESQKRTILEGSQEWDILYRKYYNEEVKKLGI